VSRYRARLTLSGLEKERTRLAYARNGCGGATISPSLSVEKACLLPLLRVSLLGGVGALSDAAVRRDGVRGMMAAATAVEVCVVAGPVFLYLFLIAAVDMLYFDDLCLRGIKIIT